MSPLDPAKTSAFLAAFPSARRDEPMAPHTYLKIGGPARLYLEAADADALVRAVSEAKRLEIPWAVVGGGSNLLVSDEGYEGLVVVPREMAIRIEGERVVVSAGAVTALVARKAAEAGLTGFAWGVGVPGTIGGAVAGNAGCFGGEMKDVVESVDAFDPSTGGRKPIAGGDCGFGYRESRFKREPLVILAATLRLKPGDPATIKAEMDAVAAKRQETQPQGAFTAGCLFKNVDLVPPQDVEKLRREADVPAEFLAAKRVPAGWLIDRLDLKGTTVGRAQVSPVHGNFLVNLGGATAQDVLALSSLVKMKVRDGLGILLEDEVRYLGF